MYRLKINIFCSRFIFFFSFILFQYEKIYCKEATKISLQNGTKGVIKEAKDTYLKSRGIFDTNLDEHIVLIDTDQISLNNEDDNKYGTIDNLNNNSCFNCCCMCNGKYNVSNNNNQKKEYQKNNTVQLDYNNLENSKNPQKTEQDINKSDYINNLKDKQEFIKNNLIDISDLSWEKLDNYQDTLKFNDLDNPGYREYFSDLGLDFSTLWEAKEGESLKEAIEKWGEKINWKIIWEANCDYVLLSTIRIEGTIDSVVSKLIGSYINAENPLKADLYPLQSLIVVSNF